LQVQALWDWTLKTVFCAYFPVPLPQILSHIKCLKMSIQVQWNIVARAIHSTNSNQDVKR
jgi:hypothetical protein